LFPVETTSQPYVFERAIRSTPRTRACRFSAARPASPPSISAASASVNAPTTDSIGISRNAQPRLSATRRASERVSSELNLDGMDTQWTRSAPSASTHSAAVTAESIPPETPITTSANPFFST
jgi:hypothetical protein